LHARSISAGVAVTPVNRRWNAVSVASPAGSVSSGAASAANSYPVVPSTSQRPGSYSSSPRIFSTTMNTGRGARALSFRQ
jgi:hypothetical protein